MASLQMNTEDSQKIIVFDLDETLGHFVELSIFIDAIKSILKKKITDDDFFKLMDMFPEFIRPNIIKILNYLKKKRAKNKNIKVMIYTNNNGPKSWAIKIKDYFEYKIKTKLFEQIIAAFKINGKQIELCRTSHEKSYFDFLRCTKLPNTTQICFIDDKYHPLMDHDNVYYVHVKPYNYSLKFDEMASRYYSNQNNIKMDENAFIKHVTKFMKQYNYNTENNNKMEIEISEIVAKRIMQYLEDFLEDS